MTEQFREYPELAEGYVYTFQSVKNACRRLCNIDLDDWGNSEKVSLIAGVQTRLKSYVQNRKDGDGEYLEKMQTAEEVAQFAYSKGVRINIRAILEREALSDLIMRTVVFDDMVQRALEELGYPVNRAIQDPFV